MPTQTYFAQDLIKDAARTVQIFASGEGLSTDELNDGLISLNKLVDGWSALGLLIMQITETPVSLSGHNGSTGLALGFRPSKLKSAACSSGTLSAPVEILSAEAWAQITDLSRSGKYATKMFCDYALNSNIFWWPTATGTLHLYYDAALAQWPDLAATAITLQPAYARGLTLNLAMDLAEQYGKQVTQSLRDSALAAKQDIATANNRIFGNDPLPDQPLPQSPVKVAAQQQPNQPVA